MPSARFPPASTRRCARFAPVGGTPRFFARGDGAYLWDADGKRYHRLRRIVGAGHPRPRASGGRARGRRRRRRTGLSFGAPTEIEIEMAETLCRLLPSIELVRLVSSGTEATMSALRLARGFTGRSKIVKFEGCYHGHGDSLLVKAGSGALTFGTAVVGGRAAGDRQRDDRAAVQRSRGGRGARSRADGERIACIIVEPIAGNMNLVMPRAGFPAGLARDLRPLRRGADLRRGDDRLSRASARRAGPLRRHAGPDDARQGDRRRHAGRRVRRQARDHGKIAPLGPVYQAGTLSGNPVAVAAGLATLRGNRGARILRSAGGATRDRSPTASPRRRSAPACPFVAQSVGGMFGIYFAPSIPDTYDAVMACDKERFNRFFHAMLDAGVYFAPSAFEAGFVSALRIRRTTSQTPRARGQGVRRARAERASDRRRHRRAKSVGHQRHFACAASGERRQFAGRKRTQSLDSSGESGPDRHVGVL